MLWTLVDKSKLPESDQRKYTTGSEDFTNIDQKNGTVHKPATDCVNLEAQGWVPSAQCLIKSNGPPANGGPTPTVDPNATKLLKETLLRQPANKVFEKCVEKCGDEPYKNSAGTKVWVKGFKKCNSEGTCKCVVVWTLKTDPPNAAPGKFNGGFKAGSEFYTPVDEHEGKVEMSVDDYDTFVKNGWVPKAVCVKWAEDKPVVDKKKSEKVEEE